MEKKIKEVCNIPDEKVCKKCLKLKPLSEYWTRNNTKDKHFGSCMECERSLYSLRNINSPNYYKYKIKGKEWKKRNPDKVKNQWLKLYYNITLEEYNKLFETQEGKCAICGKHQSTLKKSLAVDHCHVTGKVRGLLCDQCNSGLGFFKDSIELLTLAVDYIDEKR